MAPTSVWPPASTCCAIQAGDARRRPTARTPSTSARWARPSSAVCRDMSWAAPSIFACNSIEDSRFEVDVRVRPEVLDQRLPAPLQASGGRGRGERHVGLQLAQRRMVRAEPPAAHLDPQGTLGVRRVRGERLGLRHPRWRRGGQRRPRPRDARPALHRRPGGQGGGARTRSPGANRRCRSSPDPPAAPFRRDRGRGVRHRRHRLRRAPRARARGGHEGHRAPAKRDGAGKAGPAARRAGNCVGWP